MVSKQECPICRKSASEGQIRPMVALEEIVESWGAARCVEWRFVTSIRVIKPPVSFAEA